MILRECKNLEFGMHLNQAMVYIFFEKDTQESATHLIYISLDVWFLRTIRFGLFGFPKFWFLETDQFRFGFFSSVFRLKPNKPKQENIMQMDLESELTEGSTNCQTCTTQYII
jgi:hypothetical protein